MNEVEDLARALYREADPGGVYAADDEVTRLYWRRQAQQRLTAVLDSTKRYGFGKLPKGR